MITIRTNREPAEVALLPPFADVRMTLKSLGAVDLSAAALATEEIIQDAERVEALMQAHGLLPAGGIDEWRAMPVANPITFTSSLCGIGMWVGAAETAERAVTSWSGITDQQGTPVPVSRAALEAMLLNEAFADQLAAAIDRAAQISVQPSSGAQE